MKQKYILNGKVKSSETLPNGLYVHDREKGMPVLVDPSFGGFRIVYEREEKKTSGVQVITDSIEIFSPADGKHYTSKSEYYKALKSSGSHVLEKGEHGQQTGLKGDYNLKPELKQAIQQHLGR